MEKAFRTKRLWLVIAAIIIAVLCAVCFVACGSDEDNSNGGGNAPDLEYYSITDGFDIIAYYVYGIGTVTDADIVIKSKHNGKPVTSISGGAFSKCSNITSVVIPDSITIIGKYAFEDCSSLTSVIIPDSVTSIGSTVFSGCSNLESIEIPNSNINIEKNAFDDTAYYKDESNWENDALYIGKHLIKVKETITGECVIKQDTLTLADYAFSQCKSITKIEIPSSVISIGVGAFSGCSSLISVNIPNGITSIGSGTFQVCESLTSVEIPNSVTSIDGFAFYYCWRLTSIVIPNSVTKINGYVFENCSSLSSIVIPDSVTTIGQDVFKNTAYYDDESNWENGVLYIGKHLIKVKETITGECVIKQDTLTLADYAFEGCNSLTNVSIPFSIVSIGFFTFDDCSSLNSITFDGSIEHWKHEIVSANSSWNYNSSITTVVCTDGTITLSDD